MADFNIKRGDTYPPLEAYLVGPEGPLPLAGATIRVLIRKSVDAAPIVDAVAAIADVATSKVRYPWQPGDTNVPGEYLGEWKVTLPSSEVVKIPNDMLGFTLKIHQDLAD